MVGFACMLEAEHEERRSGTAVLQPRSVSACGRGIETPAYLNLSEMTRFDRDDCIPAASREPLNLEAIMTAAQERLLITFDRSDVAHAPAPDGHDILARIFDRDAAPVRCARSRLRTLQRPLCRHT